MTGRSEPTRRQVISFGPFRLLPASQLLPAGDVPVSLGGRAHVILAALLERAGQVVSKQDLIAHVWPNIFVEEANLRVHVAALRKALAARDPNGRYIANIPGRGYCFVAAVTVADETPAPPVASLAPAPPADWSPAGEHILGRAEIIAALGAQLSRHRCVTIVGPGGIGKTTVALAVADALAAGLRDGVRVVDLTPLADPLLVPTAWPPCSAWRCCPTGRPAASPRCCATSNC